MCACVVRQKQAQWKAQDKATGCAATACKLSAPLCTYTTTENEDASGGECVCMHQIDFMRLEVSKCTGERTPLIASPSWSDAIYLERFSGLLQQRGSPLVIPPLLHSSASLQQFVSRRRSLCSACLGFRKWSAERPPTQGHPSGRARPRPGARAR